MIERSARASILIAAWTLAWCGPGPCAAQPPPSPRPTAPPARPRPLPTVKATAPPVVDRAVGQVSQDLPLPLPPPSARPDFPPTSDALALRLKPAPLESTDVAL